MFSGVSPNVDSSQAKVLTSSIDDQADVGKAEAKGFGTGLTLGLVGSLARDDYVCKADYTSADKTLSAASAGQRPLGTSPPDPRGYASGLAGWASMQRLRAASSSSISFMPASNASGGMGSGLGSVII